MKTNKKTLVSIDRRLFLKSAAGQYLFMPLLPSLFASKAHATTPIPKRVIFIQMRDGTFESEYFPQNVNSALALNSSSGVYGVRLKDISGPISNIITSEWDPLRDKFSLVRGLGYLHFAFHKACAPFSGSESKGAEDGPPSFGSSIDCILEHSPRFITSTTPIAPIRISNYRTYSWWRQAGGNDTNVIKKTSLKGDKVIFNSVFGSGSVPPVTTLKSSLIADRIKEEFNALINNKNLGSSDVYHLRQHLDHVHELQKRVIANQPICTHPTQKIDAVNTNDRTFENYFDTIVSAFTCDLTRIATLFIDSYDGQSKVGSDVHHDNSHRSSSDPVGLENCRRWQGWTLNKVAYLMKALDRVPQPDGKTLLDHTLVIVANEDGLGNEHSAEGLQLILGGAAQHLNMGYYIDYRRRPLTRPAGVFSPEVGLPWTGALISIMKALGLSEDDYLHQGSGGGLFGSSPYTSFRNKYSNPDFYRKNPLPFLYKS